MTTPQTSSSNGCHTPPMLHCLVTENPELLGQAMLAMLSRGVSGHKYVEPSVCTISLLQKEVLAHSVSSNSFHWPPTSHNLITTMSALFGHWKLAFLPPTVSCHSKCVSSMVIVSREQNPVAASLLCGSTSS